MCRGHHGVHAQRMRTYACTHMRRAFHSFPPGAGVVLYTGGCSRAAALGTADVRAHWEALQLMPVGVRTAAAGFDEAEVALGNSPRAADPASLRATCTYVPGGAGPKGLGP